MKTEKNWFKYVVVLIISFLFRLLPFRAPNVEPILSVQMPFARAYGASAGFAFGFLSIVLYDFATKTLGFWTFFTAGAYGLLGLFAYIYFKWREAGGAVRTLDYVGFALVGTLFFDAVTGLSVGPLFFHQSFYGAFLGQIPFTALHLVGNISFAFVLSPALYDYVKENPVRNPIVKISHQEVLNIRNVSKPLIINLNTEI
jgi:uncharacterized membrane protein